MFRTFLSIEYDLLILNGQGIKDVGWGVRKLMMAQSIVLDLPRFLVLSKVNKYLCTGSIFKNIPYFCMNIFGTPCTICAVSRIKIQR